MKKPLKISLIVISVIVGLVALAYLVAQAAYTVSVRRGKGLVDLKVNGLDGPKITIAKGEAPTLSWNIDGSVMGAHTCYLHVEGYDGTGIRKSGRAIVNYLKDESDARDLFIVRYDTLEDGRFWLNCRPKENGFIAAFKSYGDLVKFKTVAP